MTRIIQSKQVREGDVLILRRERKITAHADADADGDFQDERGLWVLKAEYDTIELVSRAQKPLPEEVGTFIRRTDLHGVTADTSWIVGPGDKMFGQDGTVLTRDEFMNRTDGTNFSFDVIA